MQVTKNATGSVESSFLLERREDLRAIRMSCGLTGMYADWSLTPAQGGTFVELEMGMDPRRDRPSSLRQGARQELLPAVEQAVARGAARGSAPRALDLPGGSYAPRVCPIRGCSNSRPST